MIHERGTPAGAAGGRPPEDGQLHALLRRLAARGPSPWPVLSVYVNARGSGGSAAAYRPFLKKALAEALHALPPRSPEHGSLLVDTARAQHYLDYEIEESTHAVALFASFGGSDLFEAVQFPVPFPANATRVGPLPWLYPLLVMADRAQRAAVLLADSQTARLFVIAFGRIEVRREVRSPVTQRIKGAGEGDAQSVQRHVDEARKKHARLAVSTLEDLVRKAGATWLVVGGEAVILPELDAALSHEARERLLGPVVPWDVRLPEAELAARVQAQVEAREADARRALATRLAEPMHAGRTVRGLEDALAALRRGSVSELVLSTAFPAEAEGWACISCRGFGDGDTPAVCPDCGRATTSTVSLREELGHQALARGARVRIVEGGDVPAFDAQGGIGAVLRFP